MHKISLFFVENKYKMETKFNLLFLHLFTKASLSFKAQIVTAKSFSVPGILLLRLFTKASLSKAQIETAKSFSVEGMFDKSESGSTYENKNFRGRQGTLFY